ncbi:hypothetical protein FHT02_004435 [Sphingomonas xinjiangensis]|uniref:Uncharacterized protein n=1 Tax=Sphingomonas xinjiangensis TaxID=643568 RepID=A0A840YU25_9SPHN|nr:hypothetical protein [Sphingomonas xinjiangensis]
MMYEELARELKRVNRFRYELGDPVSKRALAEYARDLESSLNSARRVSSALRELAAVSSIPEQH